MAGSKKRRDARRARKIEAEPKWKVVERVVALLEKAISPESRVELDQKLPELDSGLARQCDVVIRSGKPPRETLTIVEVQDRSRKVDLDKFRGWVEKMRKVGAQHLICVSVRGFPDSIKRDARAAGPTIRLLTLEQLERSKWPLNFALGSVAAFSVNFKPTKVDLGGSSEDGNALDARPETREVPFADPVLEREGKDGLISVGELVREASNTLLRNDALRPESYPARLALAPSAPHRMWFRHEDGRRCAIGTIVLTGVVDVRMTLFPIAFTSYRRVEQGGTEAWLAEASGSLDEHSVTVRQTFTPDGNGFRPGPVDVEGLPDGTDVNMLLRPLRQSDIDFFSRIASVRRDSARPNP